MNTARKILFRTYAAVAIGLMALGFAALLSPSIGLHIPFVSTTIIPALQRHAVWGETLKGPAILVRGEDWFFLIILGLVILFGVLTALLSRWLQAAPAKKAPTPGAGSRRLR
jgi:hypothetical protein